VDDVVKCVLYVQIVDGRAMKFGTTADLKTRMRDYVSPTMKKRRNLDKWSTAAVFTMTGMGVHHDRNPCSRWPESLFTLNRNELHSDN